MSTPTEQLLRRLLPRYFWLRDAEDGGGVLAALVAGLASQYEELRTDVDVLYDQFFIATCDPQYIPLIGDEIGIEGLAPVTGPGVGDRALVGRMIDLRRRKGTLATAARGVIAASGWATYIQEGRAVVSATASVRDPDARPGFAAISGRTPAADRDQPWSSAGRTAAFSGRPVVAGEPSPGSGIAGSPAPATVSLHVWRLMSFPVAGRTAAPAHDAPARLAGRAYRLDPLGRDTQLFTIPTPALDRELAPEPAELPLPLTDALLAQALRSGGPSPVQVTGCPALAAGDLSRWQHQPRLDHADAVVDPRLGRLLLARPPASSVEVSYAYGFPGELGGGPYGTADDYAPLAGDAAMIQVAQAGAGTESSIEAAVEAAGGRNASIAIEDSGTYVAPPGGWAMVVPDGVSLRIASAPEAAPVFVGDLRAQVGRQGRLELSGIIVEGTLSIEGQGELAIEQCTLAPSPGRDSLRAATGVAVSTSFTILGQIEAGDLTLSSSIVEGSIACTGSLDLEQTTVLGSATAPTLHAGDCIVTGALSGERGLVRTSYTGEPNGSLQSLGVTGAEDGAVQFASTRFGDPAYCQLSLTCPSSIAAGGALGSEMGAFNWLGQPERFARVPLILQELLPAGIGASVNYVN